jgi:hypothetical protein
MATTKYIVNNLPGQTINGESILPGYKVYTALLTQTGIDAPVSTVLENNTTFTFSWSYVNEGIYDLNISSAVDLNKIMVLTSVQYYNGPSTSVILSFEQNTSTEIKLRFRCQSGFSAAFFNSLLLNHGLEIRIYN